MAHGVRVIAPILVENTRQFLLISGPQHLLTFKAWSDPSSSPFLIKSRDRWYSMPIWHKTKSCFLSISQDLVKSSSVSVTYFHHLVPSTPSSWSLIPLNSRLDTILSVAIYNFFDKPEWYPNQWTRSLPSMFRTGKCLQHPPKTELPGISLSTYSKRPFWIQPRMFHLGLWLPPGSASWWKNLFNHAETPVDQFHD